MAENFKDQFKIDNDRIIISICGYCAKDQGLDQKKIVDAGWVLSHGVCRRHAMDIMKSMGQPPKETEQFIKKLESSDKPPARDLNDPKNKPLLNWFKKPTPNPKSAPEISN
jgi:hypothetical protein